MVEPNGPYVSLSHRWGEHITLMTTQETLGSFMNAIDISKLPRTFQDAIVVTDSLCIIQNDSDDWQREASNMGLVYRKAFCNISALDPESSNNGFLSRKAGSVQPTIIHLAWKGYLTDAYTIIDKDFWIDRIQNAPLNHRGWVFQERFLAPRILHFDSEQAFWECQGYDACETYPQGLPSFMHRVSMEQSNKLSLEGEHEVTTASGEPDFSDYHCWRAAVEDYSRCALTMETDKLVAISGIAKIFQARLRDDYLAGLWRRVLVTDLLWKTSLRDNESHGRRPRRPKEYRAPSWSWAPVDGVIQAGYGGRDESCLLATVIDAKVTLLSDDPTGRVVDGAIWLRGTVYPCLTTIEPKRFRIAGLRDSSGKSIAYLEYDVRLRHLP